MSVQTDELVRRAWEELEGELEQQGYQLIEVELGRQSGALVLRLFLDKEGGVTLDDCQAASRFIGPYLDKKDFLGQSYYLEVSSPGIDRPVRKPEDFKRFVGEPIRIQLAAPSAGRKRVRGELKDFHDGLIVVEDENGVYEVHIENVKRANLDR